MKCLVVQDLRFSQLCCWRWSLLGGDAVSLAEGFPAFCRIMVPSTHWAALSQQRTVTSQKTWILSPLLSTPSLEPCLVELLHCLWNIARQKSQQLHIGRQIQHNPKKTFCAAYKIVNAGVPPYPQNTFPDLLQLHGTMDNTEHYI
jgi:hypothetical protein